VFLFAFCLALGSCGSESTSTDAEPLDPPTAQEAGNTVLRVVEPRAMAAPQNGTSGVFLTLLGGTEPDTLLEAASVMGGRVEIHESFDAGGGLRGMRAVRDGIVVQAGEGVTLAPGGFHIMLMRLRETLAVGDTIDVDLTFSRSGLMRARVPVVGLDAINSGD
jgi:copper(I)-binding protein